MIKVSFSTACCWLLLLLSFGTGRGAVQVPVLAFEKAEDALILNEWLGFGPFRISSTSEPLPPEVDFLARVEQLGTSGELQELLEKRIANEPSTTPISTLSIRQINAEIVDLHDVCRQPYLSTAPPTVAYVACTVQCSGNRTGYFLLGSSDGASLFVNGRKVYAGNSRRGIAQYSDAIPLTLNRGANFLLVKIPRFSGGWGITARIEPNAAAATATAFAGQAMNENIIMDSSLVPSRADGIAINPRGVPLKSELSVSLTDIFDRPVAVAQTEAGSKFVFPAALAPGLYRCVIRVGDVCYQQPFLFGEVSSLIDAALTAASGAANTEWARDQVEILAKRLTYLKNQSNPGKYERNLVSTLAELALLTRDLESASTSYYSGPGLHLRGYRSGIDGQLQGYRIYIPRGATPQDPLPLIVFLPTSISAAKPFIESAFLAAQSEADRVGFIADRYHVAVLWPGYKNQPMGIPCEMGHYDEVLRQVCKDYPIDDTRISLFGVCSGAAIATRLGVVWPHRFSGVGLLSPEFRLRKTVVDFFQYYRNAEFQKWFGNFSVEDQYLKDTKIPTFLVWDGAEPNHGDLEDSLHFVENARKVQAPVVFSKQPQGVMQHFSAIEDAVRWLACQPPIDPRDNSLQPRVPYVFDHRDVAGVFGRHFIVVVGTNGSNADIEGNERASRRFADQWEDTFFGRCIVRKDRDLSADDEARANLVLIGNGETNLIWHKYRSALPVVTGTGVTKGGQRWDGERLVMKSLASVPTAENPDRQFVLLGAASFFEVDPGNLHLAEEGWFSFSVWQPSDRGNKLMYAER